MSKYISPACSGNNVRLVYLSLELNNGLTAALPLYPKQAAQSFANASSQKSYCLLLMRI